MSMSGTVMGTAMLAAINSLPAGNPTLPVGDPANNGTQLDPLATLIALSNAIVAEIQNHATVIIKPTDAGLQRDNTGGTPATLAPLVNKTLPGGCIS